MKAMAKTKHAGQLMAVKTETRLIAQKSVVVLQRKQLCAQKEYLDARQERTNPFEKN